LAEIPRRLKALGSRSQANLLFAIWFGLILLFFSLSTRQEYYILPALPALALLIGGAMAKEEAAQKVNRRSSDVLLAIGAAAFVFAMAIVVWTRALSVPTDVAAVLTKNPDKYALSFGHFSDLTLQSMSAFRLPLLVTAFALLFGTGLNWFFRRRALPHHGNAALAAMMVVVLFCSHEGLVIFEPVLSSKDLAKAIMKGYRPGEIIVINGEYEQGSTLNFYGGVQVHILNGRSANLWYGSYFPDAPQIFEDDASFRKLWAGPARVYLWTEDDRRGAVLEGIDSSRVYDLAHSGGKVILTNQQPE
jgi:hypothetical protein